MAFDPRFAVAFISSSGEGGAMLWRRDFGEQIGNIAGSDGDQWTDPKGMFLAAAGAGPVYRLLGKKGLGTNEFPAAGTAIVDGDLAWRQHILGHTLGPNWPFFLDFAARYFESK
jgi:hypothetical protein